MQRSFGWLHLVRNVLSGCTEYLQSFLSVLSRKKIPLSFSDSLCPCNIEQIGFFTHLNSTVWFGIVCGPRLHYSTAFTFAFCTPHIAPLRKLKKVTSSSAARILPKKSRSSESISKSSGLEACMRLGYGLEIEFEASQSPLLR